MTNEHTIYEATIRQITGLELEREAHLQQIRALVAERDALRADLAELYHMVNHELEPEAQP